MVTKLKPLHEYGSDVYSQNGEDGILTFLLDKLSISDGLVLEVGANDGVWCSNTRNLYANNQNYKALLIEGDQNAFSQLTNNTKNMPNVQIVNKFIEADFSSENSIDKIIENSVFKDKNFVLASIDIDGEDYNVWKQMMAKPKIVIIEVPIFFEEHPVKKNINDYTALGDLNGYTFLGMSGILNKQAGNLIFLLNEMADVFELQEYYERVLLEGGTKWVMK